MLFQMLGMRAFSPGRVHAEEGQARSRNIMQGEKSSTFED